MASTTITHSVDPNVGNRRWTKFIKLGSNNRPESLSESPKYIRLADGSRPVDEWLAEEGFRGYIDTAPPEYNKYTQKIVKIALADLPFDNATQSYTQTWRIVNLTVQEKADMIPVLKEDINNIRTKKIEAGCTIVLTGLTTPVQVAGDSENARNISNLAILANMMIATNTAGTIPFRDEKNVIHTLTPAQVLELWRKSVQYVSAVYAASWALKDSNPIPLDITNPSYWPSAELL